MNAPSSVPSDRPDKDFCPGPENFTAFAAFRETNEDLTYSRLIDDLLSGPYGQVLRVVPFNSLEDWSHDAAGDIAEVLEMHIAAERCDVPEGLRDLIEGQLGRKIGPRLSWL